MLYGYRSMAMKQAIDELIALDHSFGQVVEGKNVSLSCVLKVQDDLFLKLKKQKTNSTNWYGL